MSLKDDVASLLAAIEQKKTSTLPPPSIPPEAWKQVREFLNEADSRDPRRYDSTPRQFFGRPKRKEYKRYIWEKYNDVFGSFPSIDETTFNPEILREAIATELQFRGFDSCGAVSKLSPEFIRHRDNLKSLDVSKLDEYRRMLTLGVSVYLNEDDETMNTKPIKISISRLKSPIPIKPTLKATTTKVKRVVGSTTKLSMCDTLRNFFEKNEKTDIEVSLAMMFEFPDKAGDFLSSKIARLRKQYKGNYGQFKRLLPQERVLNQLGISSSKLPIIGKIRRK